MKRAAVLPILLACLAAGTAVAQTGTAFVYRASLLAILEDNGLYGDSAPLLPSPGFAVSLPMAASLRFEPGLDAYYAYYGYSEELDRAVPVAEENRSAAVFALMANLPAVYTFRFRRFDLSAALGLTADFRLCLAADDSADAVDQAEQVSLYFWGGARWLYPSASIGFSVPLSGRYRLGADLRAWFPLYRLWTGEDLPAAENLRFSLGLRLSYDRSR